MTSRKGPMRVPLATAAAGAVNLGLADKKCQNVYMEPDDTDPSRGLVLVETPGTLAVHAFPDAVRGLAQADGHASGRILIPQGQTLSTYLPSTTSVGAITGTLPGTDRWDIGFTQNQALILVDGHLYISDGTALVAATDGVKTSPALAIGSTPANVSNIAFNYKINDVAYSKGAVTAGTVPGNDIVPLGLFGAVAFDINAAGAITAIEAPANATGYANAAAAALDLPAIASGFIRMGYVTASKSDAAFTFGTTALNAASTTVAYTSTPINTVFEDLLSDAGVTQFTSVATIGQKGLFTYGPRMGFTAVNDLASSTALNYYTAENQPDDLVAVRVLGQDILLFGTDTIEIWAETGSDDDPFALQPGRVITTGCLCRDGIQVTDNSIFWVADDRTVRRLGGGDTAEIVSEPWITRKLKGSDADDIVAGNYKQEGHTFYFVRTPTACLCYDALASAIAQRSIWHTRITNLTNTWRWSFIVEDDGEHYVADENGFFDLLSPDYTSEHMPDIDTMGTEIVREFTAFGSFPEFASIPNLSLVSAKGIGTANGQGAHPLIGMKISFDEGQTWSPKRDRSLGDQGQYSEASIWRMNGSATRRGAMFWFTKSDPAKCAYKTLEEVAA